MAKIFGVQPKAWRYDGRTKDLLVDSNGVAKTCHPIDQMMMIGLCTKRGSMKSTPEIGTTLHEIQYLGNPNLQAEVEQRVRDGNPIARLIANGDVEIVAIEHEITTFGALLVAVSYINLRLDRNRVQRITNA